MPTINRLVHQKIERKEDTENRILRMKAYNSTLWRKMRKQYLMEHPLCEICLKKGKIVPAVDIHHMKSFIEGGEINNNLLYDEKNLKALCKECHGEIHGGKKINAAEIIKTLDELLNSIEEDEDTGSDTETL